MAYGGTFFQGVSFFQAATVTGARNGTSIDGTDVVLGNDVGEAGNPGQLTNAREIQINDFLLQFVKGAGQSIINGNISTFASVPSFGVHIVSDPATLRPALIVDNLNNFFTVIYGAAEGPVVHQVMDNTGGASNCRIIQEDFNSGFSFIQQFDGVFYQWNFSGSQPVLFYDCNNDNFVIGGNTLTPPGADLKVFIPGAISFQVALNAHAVDYQLLFTDSNKHLTNEGAAATVELTAIASANLATQPTGLPVFEMEVLENQIFRFVCNGDQTIRYDTNISAAGGSIESTSVGSVIRIQCTSPTTFVVISVVGTWTI